MADEDVRKLSLAEWRAGRETELPLPSGLVVTVKPVGLADLAAAGRIPAPLAGSVNKLIESAGSGPARLHVEDLAEFGDVLALVARACIVWPPVADEPDAEHLGIGELDMTDRLAVFNFANAGAAKLAPFRQPAGESVGAALPGERVRGAA